MIITFIENLKLARDYAKSFRYVCQKGSYEVATIVIIIIIPNLQTGH